MNPDLINDIRVKMQKVLGVLQADLATVRTGRATPALVENITINAYGGAQRLTLKELATIAASEAQLLTVTPFDKSIIDEIQKGIMMANVGLTPSTDGNVIRISIPPLSEERRQELIKLMHQKLENGKILIRQVRHEAMKTVEKLRTDKAMSEDELKRLEKDIQKITDEITLLVSEMGKKKEEELMQI
ncbi:MAG: ribosome recycling factor [Candidatus Levybacteria bacterium]|nr:ribosome recycling factor [Candidatus Levybacteria bacterium]